MAQAKTQENPLAQKPVMAEMEVHYHVETAAAVPSSCWPKQQQNQAKHPASCRLARSPLPAHGASQAHFYAVQVATTWTKLAIAKSWIASLAVRPSIAKPGTQIASEQANGMLHSLHPENSWAKSADAPAT